MIAHVGGIFIGLVAPLVALLAKGNESPTVRAHAIEALNFQIVWNAALIVGWILAICTFWFTAGALAVLPIASWIVIIVFSIVAGRKASAGYLYRYPATLSLVR